MIRGEDNKPVLIEGIIRDISEQKDLKIKLKKSEKYQKSKGWYFANAVSFLLTLRVYILEFMF